MAKAKKTVPAKTEAKKTETKGAEAPAKKEEPKMKKFIGFVKKWWRTAAIITLSAAAGAGVTKAIDYFDNNDDDGYSEPAEAQTVEDSPSTSAEAEEN